jgi:hypothetical protein
MKRTHEQMNAAPLSLIDNLHKIGFFVPCTGDVRPCYQRRLPNGDPLIHHSNNREQANWALVMEALRPLDPEVEQHKKDYQNVIKYYRSRFVQPDDADAFFTQAQQNVLWKVVQEAVKPLAARIKALEAALLAARPPPPPPPPPAPVQEELELPAIDFDSFVESTSGWDPLL